MGNSEKIGALYQHASEHKFDDFTNLLSELEDTLPLDEIWEGYLFRAQIKLYASDISLLDDLEKIRQVDKQPQFSCLNNVWRVDSVNRFIVFPKETGSLRSFLHILPQAGELLARWYGEQGRVMTRQMRCDIHYFVDEIDESLIIAEEQSAAKPKNNTETLMMLCSLFRCYLTTGQIKKAEQSMLDMIRLSKAAPECLAAYETFRTWANMTTSWSGESKRFYNDSSGKRQAVLDDRVEGVKMGFAHDSRYESPFVEYAQKNYEGAYTMRQYYMELLHAMYWSQAGDRKQTESYLTRLYHVATASGLYMPFVECGKQIVPLLQYVAEHNIDCPRDWLDMITARAEKFEGSIEAYQAFGE